MPPSEPPDESPAETSTPPEEKRQSYAALREPGFRFYLAGNFVSLLGLQMQRIAVGWEVWRRTESAMALAWIGLVGVIPTILLTLVVGHAADRFERKQIVRITLLVIALAAVGLALVSIFNGPILAVFGCLLVSSIARAFQQPAKQSLVPLIVPRSSLVSAITLSTTAFQLASAVGPALGGLLIAVFASAAPVYWLQAATAMTFFAMLFGVRGGQAAIAGQVATFRTVAAGVVFVFRNRLLLGAMALDLFAVLLGGATALFPVYADVGMLNVGPTGLGWMEAAPAVGAILMALILAARPPLRRSGATMLWAVAGFGVATVVFGISRSFSLSLAMLLLTGALDMISVVVRQTLIQLLTPNEMRGRVSAVNSMFIGASNDLGGFESGAVAHLTSPTISVVSGGLGTMLVVVLTALAWPELRRYGRLDGSSPAEETNKQND